MKRQFEMLNDIGEKFNSNRDFSHYKIKLSILDNCIIIESITIFIGYKETIFYLDGILNDELYTKLMNFKF